MFDTGLFSVSFWKYYWIPVHYEPSSVLNESPGIFQCSCPLSVILFWRPKPNWYLRTSPLLGETSRLAWAYCLWKWLENPSQNWNNYWLIICLSGNIEGHGSWFFVTQMAIVLKKIDSQMCPIYFLFPLEQLHLILITLPCMGAVVSAVVLRH